VGDVYYAHRMRKIVGKEDFLRYFERTVRRTIEKFKMFNRGAKVLVAVSGGKDSLALLYALTSLAEELGIKVIGLTINLGIKRYSGKVAKIAEYHYKRLGLDYLIIDLKEEYGVSLDELTKVRELRRPPCSICGIVKRYLMNKIGLELGVNVIATGHNLNDLAQFIIFSLINGRLEDLSKLTPYVPGVGGLLIAKAKPLAFTYEDETLSYVKAKGLKYLTEKCPYKPKKGLQLYIRGALNYLEEREPSSLYNLVNNVVRKINPLLKGKEEGLGKCEKCGMPSKGKICSFCKVMELSKPKLGLWSQSRKNSSPI